MAWGEDEWDAFCALLEENWPGKLAEREEDNYRLMLDGVEPHQAVGALRLLAQRGQQFRPRPPEILGLMGRSEELPPTFEEALELIDQAVRVAGAARPRRLVGDEVALQRHRDERVALQWLRERAPLAARFAELEGLGRLRRLPIEDPVWGERERRELRVRYVELAQVQEERGVRQRTRAALGLGDGAPRRLEAALKRLSSGTPAIEGEAGGVM